MSATDSFTDFLRDKCGMSEAVAKKFQDGLLKKGIDGVKIATVKAGSGTLKPVLEAVAKEKGVDDAYVGIFLSELAKFKPSDKGADDKLADKKKEVEAAVKAAREYREAVATKNKATLDATYAALDAALQQVAPDKGWYVPMGKDLVPQLNQLITDMTSLIEVVTAGDYASDFEMLTQISEEALRKASYFLPVSGFSVGHRALKTLFDLPDGITTKVLSKSLSFQESFSSNDVKASYHNDLTNHGSANTFDAEAGAFFGVGAVGASFSHSGGNTSSNSSRVNTLTEARKAVGIQTHSEGKAYVILELDELLFNYKGAPIISEATAEDFYATYGTHVIVAPQVLGGLYLLESRVTFNNDVSQESYTSALSKTLSVSAGISGWGFIGDVLGMGSAGGGHDESTLEAQAGGITSSGDKYTAVTTVSLKGPSCMNAASFRASLNNGNKCWAFINNGLKLDKFNRGNVVHQIEPVWNLFERAGRSEEAMLLRKTWLDVVLGTDAILDSRSFFSQLVDKTLFVDSLKSDGGLRDWTAPFVSKMATFRTPIIVRPPVQGSTPRYGSGWVVDLFRHQVGFSTYKVLTQFHLSQEGEGVIHYDYTVVGVSSCGQLLTANETETTTHPEPGPKNALIYLDRHVVRAPVGRILSGFTVMAYGDTIWYRYRHSQLVSVTSNVTFAYSESDVQRSVTAWSGLGHEQYIGYLDNHDVRVPEGHLLVGFRMNSDGYDQMCYEFWHVPASALKADH